MRFVIVIAFLFRLALPAVALEGSRRELDVRHALQLIDAFPGETRLERLLHMFSQGESCPPPSPEELEGIHLGIRFMDQTNPSAPFLFLIASDPKREREEQPCANGCQYDELKSWRFMAPDVALHVTPQDLHAYYLHFQRMPRNQTVSGLHVNGISDYWAGSGPDGVDPTGADPRGPHLRVGICTKIRRCGPLLVLGHVNEEKFHFYEVYFRRFDLPGARRR